MKWETIATAMDVEESLLSKWASTTQPPMPGFHRLIEWTRIVGPGMLRWLAWQCGYEIRPITSCDDEGVAS